MGLVQAADASVTAPASVQDTPADMVSDHLTPVEVALDRLKQTILNDANINPSLYNPDDLQSFLDDLGPLGAHHFLVQRSFNWRRAIRLARSVLKWHNVMGTSHLTSAHFPCDLFELGLIFESGRTHHQVDNGQYVDGNPVIWVRIGAFGNAVKHLERMSLQRIVSYAYNTPRDAIHKVHRAVSKRVSRRARARSPKVTDQRVIRNLSVKENETINHVHRAITWWINDWVRRNPNTRATLVLDFENTDFALASWSTGEFFLKLDDRFPDLFDQVIGFRYKPKLWSIHSPISMFNRIFKSRIQSSPETDRKVKFVRTEPLISKYMPRVDSRGFTMLPPHVSGACMEPDRAMGPAGCVDDIRQSNGLYSPELWQAIHNEFYRSCQTKPIP